MLCHVALVSPAGLKKVLLSAFLVALATASSAAAATPHMRIRAYPQAIHPGQVARYVLYVSDASSCSLKAPGGAASIAAKGADVVFYDLRIRGDARPGRRQVVIGCDGLDTTLQLKVLMPLRTSTGHNLAIVKGGVHASVHRVPAPVEPALEAEAKVWWAAYGKRLLAGYHAGATKGQCTDYAAARRPDFIERTYEAGYIATNGSFRGWNNSVPNWPRLARAAGMATSNAPVPGALAVWRPGVQGAGIPTGHVGWVSRVDQAAGTFTVKEMNAPRLGVVSSRTLSISPLAGRSFIY